MKIVFLIVLLGTVVCSYAQVGVNKKLKMTHSLLSKEASSCVACHSTTNQGIMHDWKNSRHAHAGVSCVDCHKKTKKHSMAKKHPKTKEMRNITDKLFISAMVTPKTCAKCHPREVKEFAKSGHFRARMQYIPKKGLHKLQTVHEGQNHPKYKHAPGTTGCIQCHGSIIKLDKNKNPTDKTWPNAGIATVWPDGSVGNCAVCHTRHKFSIAEARKPEACASCHLGPDHPNIEIYNSSKHGQIYKTEGHTWKFDDPPGAWEPGSYRAPTCATCHMSGIGDLTPTHNVSRRLKWNLWGKLSKLRNSSDPMSPLTGNWKTGRAEMKKVCSNCHAGTHNKNFFKQVDDAVGLYNEAYFKPAEQMRKELALKKLLKKNPWEDAFLKKYYYLWHHEGRRARQGAAMGGPDYAHWHGFFELMQDMYELKAIYNKRMKSGKIEH